MAPGGWTASSASRTRLGRGLPGLERPGLETPAGDWIFFGLTVASLLLYRWRVTGAADPGFRVPAYPWRPALFVVAAAYVVASSIVANPKNAVIGTCLLALGVPAYGLARPRRRGAPA